MELRSVFKAPSWVRKGRAQGALPGRARLRTSSARAKLEDKNRRKAQRLIAAVLQPHLSPSSPPVVVQLGSDNAITEELLRLSGALHIVEWDGPSFGRSQSLFRHHGSVTVHRLGGPESVAPGLVKNLADVVVVADADSFSAAGGDSAWPKARQLLRDGGLLWVVHKRVEPGAPIQSAFSDLDAAALDLSVEARYRRGKRRRITVLRAGNRQAPAFSKPGSRDPGPLLGLVQDTLGEALSGASEWNKERVPTLTKSFARALQLAPMPTPGVPGPAILEIGADGQLASAKALVALTGRPVVASNLVIDGLADRASEFPITVHHADGSTLGFPDESFSFIFGRAVLEHIDNLEEQLRECYRVLVKGGGLYLDGGPLYPSPLGHHMALRGPSGTHYGFDVMPDLLQPWQHLTQTEDELAGFLKDARGIPIADAQAIATYVFTTSDQNRLGATSILTALAAVPFAHTASEARHSKLEPPPELARRYSAQDLRCHTLAIGATK